MPLQREILKFPPFPRENKSCCRGPETAGASARIDPRAALPQPPNLPYMNPKPTLRWLQTHLVGMLKPFRAHAIVWGVGPKHLRSSVRIGPRDLLLWAPSMDPWLHEAALNYGPPF